VFHENTTWISADGILKERSSLNIESNIGFANELAGTLIDVWLHTALHSSCRRIFFPRFSPHSAIHPL